MSEWLREVFYLGREWLCWLIKRDGVRWVLDWCFIVLDSLGVCIKTNKLKVR